MLNKRKNKYKSVVLEDELIYQKTMRSMLETLPEIENLGVFSTPFELENSVKLEEIDIAFLDIVTPDESGLDLARRLDKYKAEIVFITSKTDFAIHAYDIDACDYILKPIRKERLESALEKVMVRLQSIKSHSSKNKCVEGVNASDIRYIKKERDYISVFLSDSEKKMKLSLKEAIEKFGKDKLVRIHKSYCVSVHAVDRVKKDKLYVGEYILPISRKGKANLVEKLNILA